MDKKRIIELWKQGYTVKQITEMSVLVQKSKKDERTKQIIQERVERTILEYQS